MLQHMPSPIRKKSVKRLYGICRSLMITASTTDLVNRKGVTAMRTMDAGHRSKHSSPCQLQGKSTYLSGFGPPALSARLSLSPYCALLPLLTRSHLHSHRHRLPKTNGSRYDPVTQRLLNKSEWQKHYRYVIYNRSNFYRLLGVIQRSQDDFDTEQKE